MPHSSALFALPPRSFPARSMSSPARCMRHRGRAGGREPATCAPRCSAGCARRPMAATRSMAALRPAGRRPFADGELEARSPTRKSPIVVKAPMKAPQRPATWCSGRRASARGAASIPTAMPRSVRRDLAGFFTGIDTRVGGNGRAGIAAGYTGSRTTLDGRGSADVETGTSGRLWRLELRRVQPARRRRLTRSIRSRPTGRSPSRASSTARSRTTTATPDRSSASRLRLRVRQPRGRAVRGRRLCAGRRPTRRPSAAGRRRSTSPAPRSRPAMRRSASAPPRWSRSAHDMILVPRAVARLAACVRRRDAGGTARVPGRRGRLHGRGRADRARRTARRSRARSRDRPQRDGRRLLSRGRSPATCRTMPRRAGSAGNSSSDACGAAPSTRANGPSDTGPAQ